MRFAWTEDCLAEATRLWQLDHSASVIADAIGAPSRNAVIGKMHRLGLKKPVKRFGDSAAGANPKAGRAAALSHSARIRKPEVTLPGGIPGFNSKPDFATIAANGCRGTGSVSTGEPKDSAPGRHDRLTSNAGFPGATLAASEQTAPSHKVHFFDLRLRSCRRPLWGNHKVAVGDMFFCGAPAGRGSFCENCAAEVYEGIPEQKARPERRRAA